MADPNDKHRGSQPYLPPPPDNAPESVDVPRMEPPPASLEAMVRTRRGASLPRDRDSSWIWMAALVLVLVLVLVALAYYVGLRH